MGARFICLEWSVDGIARPPSLCCSQCIGATTLDEYRKHIEKDPALER